MKIPEFVWRDITCKLSCEGFGSTDKTKEWLTKPENAAQFLSLVADCLPDSMGCRGIGCSECMLSLTSCDCIMWKIRAFNKRFKEKTKKEWCVSSFGTILKTGLTEKEADTLVKSLKDLGIDNVSSTKIERFSCGEGGGGSGHG